jgi:hypothetical protein
LVVGAALGALFGATAGAACIAGGPPIDPITGDEDAGPPDQDGGVGGAWTDAPITEPHQVTGATPSHGPFSGGQRVIVSGNGFTTQTRVWFGAEEALEVVPIDAIKVQVTAPPGAAGPVDLTTQNGDDGSTRRTLPGGYSYDKFYAAPSSGPVAGGIDVTIFGQGTSWDGSTQAYIDNKPCTALSVVSPTELVCSVPQGTPGTKAMRVEAEGETISVLDAFTYEDSVDGFKGGLSGGPLSGTLRVLVYNNFTGDPIPGAFVVVGEELGSAIVEQVGPTGVLEIADPSIAAPETVTIAAECHSPITFADVPVDTVTVYLDPILTPACGAGGDPPSIGGDPASSGQVRGEIVFPATSEFERGPFLVPAPVGDEKVVAYLFAANTNPLAPFTLPSPTAAITPSDPGSIGYAYAVTMSAGNRTLYVLAGLEDRTVSPPEFTAYSMGVLKGVPVVAEETTTEVYITMVPMDLALTLQPDPPAPGPNGPDRLLAQVSIRLGNDGFAILPAGQQAPPLPLSDDVDFVGLPWLGESFAGTSYYVSSRAVTGAAFAAPMSVVGSVQATATAFPVPIGGFVGVPSMVTPALNESWDGSHLAVVFGAGGAPVDLTVYDIAAASGLVRWTIAAPQGAGEIVVPDLRGLPSEGGFGPALPSGPISIGVYGARIDGFDYGKIRYRNLRPAGMTAYSLDYTPAILP